MKNLTCNICGNSKFNLFLKTSGKKENVSFFPSSDVIGQNSIVICKKCGLSFVSSPPDEKSVLEEYSNFKDERFASQARGREIAFNRNLRFIEKFKKPGKILDVGTANGSFLYMAKKRGWKVEGIEPNKYLIKWAKENYKLDIKQGTLFNVSFKDKFDIITLWDVLEHVFDPSKTLARCHELLKDEGLIVINYPDYKSSIAKILGKKWPFYLSVHLYYFDKKTISLILKKSGFRIIKIKPHMQYLDLGYILLRTKPYFGTLSPLLSATVNLIGMQNRKIPYWLGQTLVIAKKISK